MSRTMIRGSQSPTFYHDDRATATMKGSSSSSSSSFCCFNLPHLINRLASTVVGPPSPPSRSNIVEKRQETNPPPPPPPPTPFDCIICLGTYPSVALSSYKTDQCNHTICQECMRPYLEGVLEDSRYTSLDRIQCPDPGCKQHFMIDDVLPKIFSSVEVQQWWVSAITKTFIENKIYCPLSGCSALFDVDAALTRQCTFTECYECNRGFCIACQQRWHPGVIKVFDDEKEIEETLKHAKQNKWTRCYQCSRFVEKKDGCQYIHCICSAKFCYRCGGHMYDHYTCANKCQGFSKERLDSMRSSMFVAKATTSK